MFPLRVSEVRSSDSKRSPALVMMPSLRIWLWWRSIQEIFFLLFLFAIFRTLRIIALHLRAFFRGQLGKVSYEKNQFPAIVLRSGSPKSRHASESHAILDNPEKFAVGKCLCLS